ncbi:SAF domain-containing protein [Microbacterium capsulatum]|uniref:SAF domain-containing protein n=1 Tax=Microbacterium capsulatum TaxID=3041921 RepID=A0ABU0XLE0_9MICO|nr:SAF domain-containing protein [Microbacterium sp. ASV81]MDQ4215434.1 SAF domain-containing protein [Microbacterium sp. ASV81]
MSTARAARRPWTDLRFFIGLGLIVVSVVGVWLVVGAAKQTTPALQAVRTIVPGEPLTSADVRVVDVALGAVGPGYLTPATLEPGLIATRTITEGELVPAAAASDADAGRTTSVVVQSTVRVPAAVAKGAVVEVWAAAPAGQGKGFEEPRILLSEATVAWVERDSGPLSAKSTTLELVVERARVGEVLGAITAGSSLSVVPVGARS